MLNAWRPGFVHAPISKCIITLVVLSTVFSSIVGSRPRLLLLLQPLKQGQIWRLITHNFIFTTPGELLFGVVLLYFFRQLERQIGSSKYVASIICVTSIHSVILTWFQLWNPTFISASGPYALIISSLVHFFYETPKIYHFQVLSTFHFSDKFFIYMIGFQLILCYPPLSFISFISAVISSLIFRLPFIRSNVDMPQFLVSFSSTYLLPWIDTWQTNSHSSSSYNRTRLAQLSNGTIEFSRQTNPMDDNSYQNDYVSDTNIQTLVSMGFSREQAYNALQQSNDDVQRAAEQLISNS